jgi:hypothetical protein
MKRGTGQAGRIIGEAIHQLGRIALLAFLVVTLLVCLLGLRLSHGPLQIPFLASKLATMVSGQGITIRMRTADLAWAGYTQGGGVPLYLQLGGISVRNAAGVELVDIPRARLVFLPAALFSAAAPILVDGAGARFDGSAVPVALHAALRFNFGFSLARADMDVRLGAGRLGAGATSLPITSGAFVLAVTPRMVALTDGVLRLAPVGASAPVATFAGHGALDGRWAGQLNIAIDKVQAPDLGAYWPPPVLPLTRAWVTKNIIGGTAGAAAFDFTLTAPRTLTSLSMANVTGGFTGADITMGWIPGATPITQLNGQFVFLSRDDATVSATGARLGGLTIGPSQMHITGMSQRRQFGDLNLPFTGPLGAAIALLNAPPLRLLSQAPPQVTAATGDLTATVQAHIPFLSSVKLAEVRLTLKAALRNAAAATPLAGVTFSGGTGTITATSQTLALDLNASLAGAPAHLTAAVALQSPAALRAARLDSTASPALLHALGLDRQSALADPVKGAMPFSIAVAVPPAGAQSLSATADLTPAMLALPSFGWRKPAGAAGHFTLDATLQDGALQNLSGLALTAPGLDIEARGQGGVIAVPVFDIGRSMAHGDLSPPAKPGSPWAATLEGPVLDVRAISSPPQHAAPAIPPPASVNPTGPAWTLRLVFGQLDLAAAPAPDLCCLALAAAGRGDTVLSAHGHAGAVSLDVSPAGDDRRRVVLQAPDAGLLLEALGAYQNMQGGGLTLDAQYGGGTPVTGQVTIDEFRLRRAPGFTKIMQALTIYGLGAASGPGLGFDRAVVPFSLSAQTLRLNGARAYSASLGFTASGPICVGDGTADLSATIIPAYALNALPGKLPLVGKLFTAETGGGLFALRATITGDLSNPVVTLNPLSALTPGVLRDVFGSGASK